MVKRDVTHEPINQISSGASCDLFAGPSPEAVSPVNGSPADLTDDLEQLRARARERDQLLDLLRRTRADFENYQKRVRREREEERRCQHGPLAAEGEVCVNRSFYFRGPEGKLNLRAQNLILFMQLAEGVDEGTWMYHLRRGDYSRWFRKVIKDKALAAKAAGVESQAGVSAEDSRGLIAEAIEEHYTLPA